MLTEERFDTEEVALSFARTAGTGPPLLLLHGVTRCWRTFVPLLPALVPRWRVYGLDFRGHGGSGRARGRYRVVDYVRDALCFLRDCVDEAAVVYGHSLGAMVAAAVAAEAPRLVRAVVLEDPPFATMGNSIAQTPLHSFFAGMRELAGAARPVAAVARDLAEVRVVTPGTGTAVRLGDTRDATTLRFMASCLARVDPDVFAPILAGRWLEGYDRAAVLSRVRCPALLLQADPAGGGMLPEEDAARVAAALPDCVHVSIADVGHAIHWLSAEALLRHVLAFLESL